MDPFKIQDIALDDNKLLYHDIKEYRVRFYNGLTLYVPVSNELTMHCDDNQLKHIITDMVKSAVLKLIDKNFQEYFNGNKISSNSNMQKYFADAELAFNPKKELLFEPQEVKFNVNLPKGNKSIYPHGKNAGFSGGSVKGSLFDAIPGLQDKKTRCPVKNATECNSYTDTKIFDVVIHLNDSHEWTREEIADWLETLDVDLSFKVDNA